MKLYTIGFTKKSAKDFFEIIKHNNIQLLIDIRLNNKSQLAGFTKGNDLKYFLDVICKCDYTHEMCFAPTKEILDSYKKKTIDWNNYTSSYVALMKKRSAVKLFLNKFYKYEKVCLLCSEPVPDKCHRRLLAELIQEADSEIVVSHL